MSAVPSAAEKHIAIFPFVIFPFVMPPFPTLSLVLPCYNEEANVERTVQDVLAWFDRGGIQGEVIAVDDGSKDATASILQRLASTDRRLRIVRHDKNQGYGLAVRSGCDAGTQEIIAFMDSDGQFHAEDLWPLLLHLREYAFVTGRRRKRADSPVRNFLGKVLGGMNVLLFGLWVRDVNCGMKVFRREIWQSIRPTRAVEKLYNTEMFLRLKRQGIPWKHVDVPHYPRRAGKPTGASAHVILRMIKELWDLRIGSAK